MPTSEKYRKFFDYTYGPPPHLLEKLADIFQGSISEAAAKDGEKMLAIWDWLVLTQPYPLVEVVRVSKGVFKIVEKRYGTSSPEIWIANATIAD